MPESSTTSRPGPHQRLRALYFGKSRKGRAFRYGLIAFDIFTLIVFVVVGMVEQAPWVLWVDLALAALIAIEWTARLIATFDRRRMILSWGTLADAIVFFSLVAPMFMENLAFLRVVRSLRLLRSYRLLSDLRADVEGFRAYEDVILRAINLGVFLFVVSSLVFVTQHGDNPNINTFLDALYFTITTLTTTGFGDITLVGPFGKLLSVFVMIIGVTLFVRLLQVIVRPNKVRHECPACGLLVHDVDAVHCKHCGLVLHIPNEGAV
jgi:voltage-gated potassium channel